MSSTFKNISAFLKWVLIAAVIGLIGGGVGTAFHFGVEFATRFRINHHLIILLLPIGGLAIVKLYKMAKIPTNVGTNQVISSVRSKEEVPVLIAPLIFISTVITHLFGGSAGREGAALQLGGSIGSQMGRLFRLDEKDMHLITLCGMSSVFSALFGTPLTAAFFVMEVISIGIIYYSGFVPCLFSSIIAYKVSLLFKGEAVKYSLKVIPKMSFDIVAKIIILAALCAGVGAIFCIVMHKTSDIMGKISSNEYVRAIFGGIVIIGLSFIFNSGDYNGAGMNIISNAINGTVKPEAFILKMIFTAITIGAGYKGGEIVPTFFIGATFGCIIGKLIGIDAGFAAAVGLVAMFCSVVNTPISSIILSIEFFGAEGLILFAIACSVSYMLSGYYGLYSSQKIVYSKLKAEFINVNAK